MIPDFTTAATKTRHKKLKAVLLALADEIGEVPGMSHIDLLSKGEFMMRFPKTDAGSAAAKTAATRMGTPWDAYLALKDPKDRYALWEMGDIKVMAL